MEEWYQIRQEISRLLLVHRALMEGLLDSKPFRTGAVVRRFTVCGKPGCRCQRGEKHGPFWYLSEKEAGRTRLRYLGTEAKAQPVLDAVRTYQHWRRLRLRLRRVQQQTEAALDRLGAILVAAAEGGVQGWHTPCGVRLQKKPAPRS